jgi:hypothetical protein
VTRAAALAGLAAAAVSLSGCYTIRYERRGTVAEAGAPRERWHHAFLGGAVPGSRPVKLEEICPGGVAKVESQVTFLNALGQIVTTFGVLWPLHAPLWEPSTVRVVCAREGAPGARGARALRVVVLPVTPLGGVAPETARLFGDALAAELRRRSGVSVVTPADVAAMLGVEKTKQVLGCADARCAAAVGMELDADRIVHGSLGRLGDSLVVNLSAVDPRRGDTPGSASRRLRGEGEEGLLDALPALADALLVGGARAR